MSILITFLPALLVLFVALRWDTRRAFLNVYIPVMAIFPEYFYLRYQHLPPMNAVGLAALVLGIFMAFKDLPRWKFSRTDIWLAIFVVAGAYADTRAGRASDGLFSIIGDFSLVVVPYMAAKLLIEPDARIATVRRIVWFLFLVMIPSMYEFFLQDNLFRLVLTRYFPKDLALTVTQPRWGFGRLAGPYVEAELSGMILLTGIALAIWLAYWHYWEPKFKNLRALPFKKSHVIIAVLVVALAMTESRGPWIGLFLAASVAYIGRGKKITRKAVLVMVLLLAVGIPGYFAGERYLSAPATTEEQTAAQYRKNMWTNYLPLAKFGGAWGWGYNYPKIWTQESIDNEYLLIDLTRGYIGLLAFSLLSVEAWYFMLRGGLRARLLRDRHFYFTLLGIMSGLMLTIATVYLGFQAYTLYFMLIGWSQAIRSDSRAPAIARRAAPAEVSQPLIRVYT